MLFAAIFVQHIAAHADTFRSITHAAYVCTFPHASLVLR
jgi:hypothetical protein